MTDALCPDTWLAEVDEALRAPGGPSIRELAARYGLSRTQLKGRLARYRARVARRTMPSAVGRPGPMLGGCDLPRPAPLPAEVADTVAPDGELKRLVDFCRARGRSMREVCDALDVSPRRAEALLQQARSGGYTVDVSGDQVAWTNPTLEDRRTEARVEPVSGEYHLGVISDTHFGSKHCMAAELDDFISLAYAAGVRVVVHAGDMLCGQSEKIRWDIEHHGLDAQCAAAFEQLPRRDGLEYHFIDGNHDEHFWGLTGQLTGPRLVEYFAARGRHDVHCVGQRAGLVLLRVRECQRPVVVKLWHPKSGKAYALSYHAQNHIRDMPVGVKPDLLVCGHWHVSGFFPQRGVHAILAGCFEGPGSSFSQSLGGAVSNGGAIVSLGVTQHGTLRSIKYDFKPYYVSERARELEMSPGGLRVERTEDAMTAALAAMQQALGALKGAAA